MTGHCIQNLRQILVDVLQLK